MRRPFHFLDMRMQAREGVDARATGCDRWPTSAHGGSMTYRLFRGTDLLGRVEMESVQVKAMSGVLVPRDEAVTLRCETQMHTPAFNGMAASVYTMRPEPDLIGAPPPPNRPGLFALEPVADDMVVAPKDELRAEKDGEEVRAQSVWLREKRYLKEIPPEVQRRLPPGALRGQSYWEVVVFFDRSANSGTEFDDDSFHGDGMPGDELSP